MKSFAQFLDDALFDDEEQGVDEEHRPLPADKMSKKIKQHDAEGRSNNSHTMKAVKNYHQRGGKFTTDKDIEADRAQSTHEMGARVYGSMADKANPGPDKVKALVNKRDAEKKAKTMKAVRKTAKDNMDEAYDADFMKGATIKKTGEGGRKYPSKKKSKPEIRRMKAVGGGKMEPVEYKDRKDIGSDKKTSDRVEQPTQERGGSAAERQKAAAKEERRKKALARRAEKSGGSAPAPKETSKDLEKQASKLLSKKKAEKPVSPDYKPAKASGMTRQERMKVTRAGETKLKGIMKDQESSKYEKETGRKPDSEAKRKVILPRVHKRMAS